VGEYEGLDVINAGNAGGEDVNQLEGFDVYDYENVEDPVVSTVTPDNSDSDSN
jgi:hypothetical protein